MSSLDDPQELSNDTDLFPVLDSVESVVSQSQWVRFHPEPLKPAVAEWGHLLEPHCAWQHPCHFFDGSEETVRWIFVLDLLNHCFWPDVGSPVWTVNYQGESWSGYWGLAAALKNAIEQGHSITAEDLRGIFAGEGEIPLFAQRLANLREAGAVLRSRFDGEIVRLVDAARGSAVHAVRAVVEAFPSFRDEACHRGMTVYFWKRAQIFVADLYQAFAGKDWGAFRDVERLTAFADYKLPQVLRQLGVIAYHPDLARRVDQMELLPAGSEEEVEIRATTIWAVEALREAFQEAGIAAISMQVDQWLWRLGQLEAFRDRPYHRCRTIFY